jgi:lysophospholipase L1-like esterase
MRPANDATRAPAVRRHAVIWIAALAVLLACAVARADTPAAPPNPCGSATATGALSPTTTRTGLIDLYYFRPLGLPVSFYECIGRRAHPLAELASQAGSDRTILDGAAPWTCDRQTRRFAATTVAPGGEVTLGRASVRTVSCARRFALEVPAQVSPGHVATVTVTDRWGTGAITTRLCLTSPHARRSCRGVAFAAGAAVATERFRPASRGRWRVELQVRGFRVRHSVAVGIRRAASRDARPTVLATGDSTMQGVESFLSDELGRRANVISDVRPGLAFSGTNAWAPIAQSQAARLHPDVTVLSIGANEGLDMRASDGATHACCDAAWSTELAARIRATMLTYARRGRGRVFVLTIAAPRDPKRAVVTSAVNAAIVRAAAGLTGVSVLRMDLLFSPQGFRETMPYDGRDVDVREPDGTHLNVTGTKIEARVVAQALGSLG